MGYSFSGRTDEEIKNSMIENMDAEVLGITGTFSNDLLSPVAMELAQADIELWAVLNKLYINNLEGEELERRMREWTNIRRKQSTKAKGYLIITGSQGYTVPKGSIFSGNGMDYISLEDVLIKNETKILVECTEFGKIGNAPEKTITETNVSGVIKAFNPEAFKNGYNEESDEELLERFYLELREPGTSGNKFHYEKWAKEIEGVGGARVTPIWNGPGTVKVAIINRNKESAGEELIKEVKEHIEEKRPVGADVTVATGVPKNININVAIKLASGFRLQDVRLAFIESLEEYRQSIAFKDTYISHAKIGSILLSTNGILDYQDLKLNNLKGNISLTDDEMAVFKDVDMTLM